MTIHEVVKFVLKSIVEFLLVVSVDVEHDFSFLFGKSGIGQLHIIIDKDFLTNWVNVKIFVANVQLVQIDIAIPFDLSFFQIEVFLGILNDFFIQQEIFGVVNENLMTILLP